MSEDSGVGAVILAAGVSRRYGSPKQLVQIAGRTLLEHVVRLAFEARLAPVVAVVPAWLSRPAALEARELRWIRNPFPERGMGLSLRLGLAALGDDVPAAIILLGDQPTISAATIAAVLAARGDRPVVAAAAHGVLAPPVLIENSHFLLADALTGDVGLRDLLRGDPGLVTAVTVPGHPPDLDTPADLDLVAQGDTT
ncbi:MAG: nucleotidyltransferase family protein [Candidatus Limnocylindria bacterium]